MVKKLFICIIFFIPICLYAQPESVDTSKSEIEILFSELGEFIQNDTQAIRKLSGDVQLKQDSVYMYCDTAVVIENDVNMYGHVIIQQGDSLSVFSDSMYYFGDSSVANFYYDVVLKNKDKELFTERLDYDLKTKIATYFTGAILTNGATKLRSEIGYYYVNTDEIFFKDSVQVVDSSFTLIADTLAYNTETGIVTFLGPTLISQNESKIYCESGFYDTQNKLAEFEVNAQFQKNAQKATADIIRYDGTLEEVTLEGNAVFEEEDKLAKGDVIRYDEVNEVIYLEENAYYQDSIQVVYSDKVIRYDTKNEAFTTSGRTYLSDPPQILEADQVDFDNESGKGFAFGHVYWQDTSANVTIRCDTANYDKSIDYLLAIGSRPLMTNLIDGDTLFVRSDTLVASQKSETDTTRIIQAYRKVRIFKNDLQAVCDSLAYNTTDSVFYFYDNPIIWSDTSQFYADSVWMQIKNKAIDKIFLHQNAFIVNTEEELYFNQIKGRDITAFFVEGELRVMKVVGNAESIYYALDEEDAYIGVNETLCSHMKVLFGNNQIDNIKFYAQPTAKMTPMKKANHQALRLPGFRWDENLRPKSKEDL